MKVVDSVSHADAELRALIRLRYAMCFSAALILRRTMPHVVPLLDTRVYGHTREFVFPFLEEWEVRAWGVSVASIRKGMKQILTVRSPSLLVAYAVGSLQRAQRRPSARRP